MVKCHICGKEYSNKGIGTHIWRIHNENGKKFDPNKKIKNGEIVQWNKGKKFEELFDKEKANDIKKKIGDGIRGKERKLISNSSRLKMSESAKKRGLGGYVKGGGRGIHGRYKGFWCDSSWELAWVIYQLEHDVEFVRNEKAFKYVYEGKEYNYYPDFIIKNNTYIEIKGWMNNKDPYKIKQFSGKLILIEEQQMLPILEYVKKKYGRNFVKLYEESNLIKCKCGKTKYKRAKICRECWKVKKKKAP